MSSKMCFICVVWTVIISPAVCGEPGISWLPFSVTDISGDGDVAVGYKDGKAYRWTKADGMVALGSLVDGGPSTAWGISGDGGYVVGQAIGTSGWEAFLWSTETGMVGLGDLPGGIANSVAYSVADNGLAVVGYGHSVAGTEAFLWRPSYGMVGLGDLPGGDFRSKARAVSQDGTVVTGYSSSAYGLTGHEAFRWTAELGMVGIGRLPEADFSEAYAVSSDSSTVVGNSGSEQGGGVQAFRFTSATGMSGLGDLAGGKFESFTYSVSGDGSVIVGTATTATGQAPFIWDEAKGMRNLAQVFVEDYGIDLGVSTLKRATGISADGFTIIGQGSNPQEGTSYWVAVIPEPAALSLLAIGGLMLLRRRKS